MLPWTSEAGAIITGSPSRSCQSEPCCRPRSRRGTRKRSCDAVGASEPVPSDHHTRNRMVSGLRQFGTADRQEKPITSHPLDRGPATKWCSELRFAAATDPAAGIQFGPAARGLFSAGADRIAATILPRVRPSGGRNRVPASSLSPPRELPSGPVSRRGFGSAPYRAGHSDELRCVLEHFDERSLEKLRAMEPRVMTAAVNARDEG